MRADYQADPEKIKTKTRMWSQRNPEKRKAQRQRRYRRHREQLLYKGMIYRQEHRDEILSRRRISYKKMAEMASELFPNECYYHSEYCSGPLEWDHKNGDGMKDNGNDLHLVLKNPDRYMRLCRRHNKMKFNVPKDIFEKMSIDIANKCQT